MKKLLLIVPLALAFACGDANKENEVEKLNLDSEKDKLSFSLGAMNANSILTAPQANLKKLDKDLVIKGFESNFNDNDFSECEKSIIGLFGPYGQDFDTTFLTAGSECFGRMTSAQMYKQITDVQELDKFNIEMIKRGFKQGLLGVDTVNLSKEDQQATMQAYSKEMEAKLRAEQEVAGKAFWDEVMKKDVKEIEGTGIYIETIKEGSGGSPTIADDIEIHYEVFDSEGNKMDSSKDRNATFKTNLSGQLIQGWKLGIPALKKGGKYVMYVPSDLGYGNGPLKFELELFDFGPAGTIAAPQMPPQY